MKDTLPEPVIYRLWVIAQRVGALILLVALLPLFAVLFVLVKLTSRGPFLFRQSRPGVGGNLFKVWKIRTMRLGSDRIVANGLGVTKNDPQVTRIGRILRDLKLDELPQLWNVVLGQMRFVGPRPIALVLHERLCEAIPGFESRLMVPPGLTNVGQVSIYENEVNDRMIADWRLRFESDVHYLRHRSVTYDIVLFCLTLLYLLKKCLFRIGLSLPGLHRARGQTPAERSRGSSSSTPVAVS
jgi:lipopolysaccharide/colanic/teichoic acid biosynthesis glycosyltransferase